MHYTLPLTQIQMDTGMNMIMNSLKKHTSSEINAHTSGEPGADYNGRLQTL